MAGIHPKTTRRSWNDQSEFTRAIVEFHTWKDNGPSGVSTDAAFRKQVGTVVTVKTSKMFGAASGKFSLTLKKPERVSSFDYQRLWRDPEGMWVVISFQSGLDTFETFLGIVDCLSQSTSRTGMGTRNETYEVHGRCFGKIFEDTILFINQFSSVPIASYDFLVKTFESVIAKATPADCVTGLIDAWIGNSKSAAQAWELPPSLKRRGETFYSMLSLSGVQQMKAALHGISSEPRLLDPSQGGANLWDMLQHYSNGEMNELWCDLAAPPAQPFATTDQIPTVFLRERPFATKDSQYPWALLKNWKLGPADIKDRHIAKGGAACRFNYWILYPGGACAPDLTGFMQSPTYGVLPGEPGSIPIADLTSIRRHGLRKWERSTHFCPANLSLDSTDDAAFLYSQIPTEQFRVLLANWLKKIHDWYATAPMELSGEITTTRLFPEIRIGHRFTEETPDSSIDYYVEGVSHAWHYPGTGQTTLIVTRGQYEGDDLLKYVYDGRTGQSVAFSAGGVEQADDGFDPSMVDNLEGLTPD